MATNIKPIGDTTFVRSVTDRSVSDVLGKSSTAMVYGFQHCRYTQVSDALESHVNVSRVYDCSLGNDYDPTDGPKQRRLNGESIHQVDSGMRELQTKGKSFETQDCNRKCKSGLVNYVLENYRQSKVHGKEISPIIFCIDIQDKDGGNPHPLTSENLLSKTKTVRVSRAMTLEMNRIVTHSEIRRAYKLCNDPTVDPEIREIARKTFKFVKVNENRQEFAIDRGLTVDREIRVQYDLEEIPAPWAAGDFQAHLDTRKEVSAQQVKPRKDTNWRAELNTQAKEVRRESQIASAKSLSKTGAKWLGYATLAVIGYGIQHYARSYLGV